MPDRFYYPGDWSDLITLDEAESQHCARVLRKKVDEEVELFNGRNGVASGVINVISKKSVQVRITNCADPVPSIVACQTTLAVAPPKGDRFRLIIEKVTELGVDRIIPLKCERSVVDPRDTKLAKLRQTIISACKQSGRNELPEMTDPQTLEELFQGESSRESVCVFGAPRCETSFPVTMLHLVKEPMVGIVGPEGGFTDEEEELMLSHDARPMMVSPHVLRVETAAIAFSTMLVSTRIP